MHNLRLKKVILKVLKKKVKILYKINLLLNRGNEHLFTIFRIHRESLPWWGKEKWVSSESHNKNMQMTARLNTLGRNSLTKLKVIGGRCNILYYYYHRNIFFHILKYIYCFISCANISFFFGVFFAVLSLSVWNLHSSWTVLEFCWNQVCIYPL